MVETLTPPSSSSSSSSCCASFSSFDDVSVKTGNVTTVKFLCSYGGKILPRYSDGKLRYLGGDTRVLAVDRSIPFSDLQEKMGDLCGSDKVSLRCQLPTEDLDALVSVTCDEDLANLFEEYDVASRDRLAPLKIRAFLHETPLAKSSKSRSPSPPISSSACCSDRCVHHHHQICSGPSRFSGRPARDLRFSENHRHHQHHEQHGIPRNHHRCLVHHGNQLQHH